MDINEEKQKLINNINKDISKFQRQIDIINNLEIKPVDIDEWNKLCRTPLKYSPLIIEVAKATFPQGKNFKRIDINNYLAFEMNGVKIKLPFLDYKEIIIDIFDKRYFDGDKGCPIRNESNFEKELKKFLELVKSNKYNWHEIAELLVGGKYHSEISLFIWWILRGKRKLPYYIEQSQKWVDKWDRQYKKEVKHYYKMRRMYNKEIKAMKEILPKLKKFCPNLNIDEEKILNLEETINKKKVVKLGEKYEI